MVGVRLCLIAHPVQTIGGQRVFSPMNVKLAFGRDGAEVTLPSHIEATMLDAKFAEAVEKV